MRVRDVMVRDVKFCTPETNLAAVSELFWKQDCGTLPVVKDGQVVGMLTDRDLAIALGTRNIRAGDASVQDLDQSRLFSCKGEDDIHNALRTMQTQKIQRLPVIDANGRLQGILCLGHLLLQARPGGDLTYADIVETMQSVSSHHVSHAA